MSMIERFKEEAQLKPTRFDGMIGALVYEFAKEGHSGFSAPYGIDQLTNRVYRALAQYPLSPLQGTDDEWEHAFSRTDNTIVYQNKRYSALFKEIKPSGSVTFYDVDAVTFYYKDEPNDYITNGKYLSKFYAFPENKLVFPYFPNPAVKPVRVEIESLLEGKLVTQEH